MYPKGTTQLKLKENSMKWKKHQMGSWMASVVFILMFGTLVNAKDDFTQSGPWLVFDYSLGFGMGSPGTENPGGVRFEVQISDGGPYKTLYQSVYSQLRWHPYAVSLSEYAGQEVKVRFLVEHIEGRIMMDYPHWGNPRVVVGSLFDKTPPKEIFNFAMTPVNRVGGILADGTEFDLEEPDPVFNSDAMVTQGLLNRKHMLLMYAGDNYICVPGKAQPGIYMGVSMSVDR